MPALDCRNHLLWPTIARNLEADRGADAALCSGGRVIPYRCLAAAITRGAAEIDGRCAPGSRLLIAVRDQLRVGVALCAGLHSRAVPLLADPTSSDRLRALGAEWRVGAAILEPGVDLAGVERIDPEIVGSWLDADAAASFEPRSVAADEPAFWTFTSGSTGEPKAVVHAHRGPVAAYRAFACGVLDLGPEDVTIATAGLPFVYALGNNFFFPLMAGGTAILPSDLLLPTVLAELARHGATLLVAGPWSLAAIARLVRRPSHVEAIRGLRLVLSAGEPLPRRVFQAWVERFGKRLLDNLGCTEMFNSFISNVRGGARPDCLGRPVPGFEVRVGGVAPMPGRRGPLSVRGASRAVAVGSRGMLSAVDGEWCETGDEVAVESDGALVFLGRLDDGFKVKGQFVRPVEAERCLSAVTGVAECLVLREDDPSGVATVVAKIVPAEGARSDELVRRVLRHARARLLPFAVPARVDLVEALVRSDRGKLKRPGPERR